MLSPQEQKKEILLATLGRSVPGFDEQMGDSTLTPHQAFEFVVRIATDAEKIVASSGASTTDALTQARTNSLTKFDDNVFNRLIFIAEKYMEEEK